MAGLEISPRSIRQQIASAINVVVQPERMEDGRRRVISISEIVGMEEDVISMQEIFRFRRRGHARTARSRENSRPPACGRNSWICWRRAASNCPR